LDAAGPGAKVNVPPGIFYISTPLAPASGQTIDCAGGDIIGQAGSIIRPRGSIWALHNPRSGSRALLSVTVRNCVFDLSNNPSALGAINLNGISQAKIYNQRIVLASTGSQIAIQFDGEHWRINSASYWNDIFGADIYATGEQTQTNSHICLLFLNGANDNHVYGGSCQRAGIGIKLQSGDNNLIAGFGVDGWAMHCIELADDQSVRFNLFLHNRCETYQKSDQGDRTSIAVLIGAHAADNQFFYPLLFRTPGTVPLVDDSEGANTLFGVLNRDSTLVYELSSQYRGVLVGINKVPNSKAALQISGLVESDFGFVPATAGRASLGEQDKPFSSMYLGSTSGNNVELVAKPGGVRKIMLPDASGTLGLVLGGASALMGGTRLAAGQCTSETVKVAGALPSMVALTSGAGSDPGENFTVRAFVAAPNAVTVRVCAIVAGTPALSTYNVRVLQ
jgi:hypothetical protein